MSLVDSIVAEAERYRSHRALDRAAQLYARAIKLDQDSSPEPRTGLAHVALMLGRRREAANLLEGVLTKHPRSLRAHLLRGIIEEADGQLDRAIAHYTLALGIDRESGPAYVNLGRALAQQGKWSEALPVLKEASTRTPSDQWASLLAVVATHVGQLDQALQAMTTHLRRNPSDIEALIVLSDLLRYGGQTALADEIVRDARQRFPKSAMLKSYLTGLAS